MTSHGYRALRNLTSEARVLIEHALASGWRLEPSGSRLLILAHLDGRRLMFRAEPDKNALAKLRREVRA